VVLPWSKSAAISIQSIKARFFRSLVTTLTLVFAVSFLAFILVSVQIANGLMAEDVPGAVQKLKARGYDIPGAAASVGQTAKQRWIAVLSLLVCVVGITNAQLMAVTERFREIGTMKCLGALNRFVVRLFVLEAGFQGLFGGVAGALLGGFFAFADGLSAFGFPALTTPSAAGVLAALGLSAAVGLMVSIAGALYPALVAARMSPAVAMRTEV